ncbi:hypothetical protein HPB48_003433 [Haemaphysalis longicornis]|uniref:Uncharacterized protein n=1 Tax=Haemaphysalis longicornis TaxID=44386 RepID=A0A9J6G9R0_HAELO|nr:hypothetical protein HPB48_003433 [Haemaphysalis longicornis]
MWGKPYVRSLGIYKKGACLDSFLGRSVEEVEAVPQDVPFPQDPTEVAALLDGLWEENCVLVAAIQHELSVQIPQEPAKGEVVHYAPQFTHGYMRSTDIYRSNDSYDICDDMADVLVAPGEITDIEQKTREPSHDLSLWKRMRALRISARRKAHSVLRSRKEPSVLAKSFFN